MNAELCEHIEAAGQPAPRTPQGCEECLKIGQAWVHLRICRTCGHVGCCDQSPGRHATKHFHITHPPIMEGYDPPEGWGWCYIDDIEVDLPRPRRRGDREAAAIEGEILERLLQR